MLKTFMLEPTYIVHVSLRRYQSGDNSVHPERGWSYHNASILVGEEKAVFKTRTEGVKHPYTVLTNSLEIEEWEKKFPHDHPKWPTECDWCNYKFKEEDEWQIFTKLMYRRSDNGELVALIDAPPGAMYYAWWLKDNPRYPDTGPLYAICPNGHGWNIDGRASNCGSPDDDVHRCWVRHGDPPEITVDKNGVTCTAGAGSIQAGDYHGFLQNGHFTDNG